MLFDVMESMLGDVCNTGVGMLPDLSNLRLDFSNKKLDHGGLSGAILTNTGDTGTERNLDGNVEQSGTIVDRVGESTLAHLHEGLSLRLDTLNGTGVGELELHLRFTEGEVSTGGRVVLYVFIEVTLVAIELQVVERKDVGTAVIEKTRIVTDEDGSHIGEGVEVSLDPSNVDNV